MGQTMLALPGLETKPAFSAYSTAMKNAKDADEGRTVIGHIEKSLWAFMADAKVQPFCGAPELPSPRMWPDGATWATFKPLWRGFSMAQVGFSCTKPKDRRNAVSRMKALAGVQKAARLREMIEDAQAAMEVFEGLHREEMAKWKRRLAKEEN